MRKQRRNVLRMLAAAAGAYAGLGWSQKKTAAKVESKPAPKIEAPVIAVSADMQFPMSEIVADFERVTRFKLQVTLGASGRLYQQILEGAPFEMFLSADEDFALKLAEAGKSEGKGAMYAIGRLAFYTPSGSALNADNFLSDIRTALRDGRLQRFAIANPEYGDYGKLSEEVLRRKLVWEDIQPKLAIGEDVAQAAQFAVGGSIQGGLVAYAQAGRLMAIGGGKCVLVSDTLYETLKQRMVLLSGAGETARQFYRYMQGNVAREVLKRYGFLMPKS